MWPKCFPNPVCEPPALPLPPLKVASLEQRRGRKKSPMRVGQEAKVGPMGSVAVPGGGLDPFSHWPIAPVAWGHGRTSGVPRPLLAQHGFWPCRGPKVALRAGSIGSTSFGSLVPWKPSLLQGSGQGDDQPLLLSALLSWASSFISMRNRKSWWWKFLKGHFPCLQKDQIFWKIICYILYL